MENVKDFKLKPSIGITMFHAHENLICLFITLSVFPFSTSALPLTNITKSHLVAYDPEKDLLPLILAHCNYSLKVGEGTAVEYNWKALERQLVDRFIRGRHQLTPAVRSTSTYPYSTVWARDWENMQ